MTSNFSQALKFTLQFEGGYVNNPHDTGGETNYGVTHTTYNTYRKGKKLVSQSVKLISHKEVEEIYFSLYWLPAGCGLLLPKLALCHFDWAVNHGVNGAVKTLQRVVETSDDGIIGDMTKQAIITALSKHGEKQLCNIYCLLRENWYRRRVQTKPSQKIFLQGWLNRVHALKKVVAS